MDDLAMTTMCLMLSIDQWFCKKKNCSKLYECSKYISSPVSHSIYFLSTTKYSNKFPSTFSLLVNLNISLTNSLYFTKIPIKL